MKRKPITGLFRLVRHNEGASAIEFGLVMFILIPVLGGAVEFGRAFQHYLVVNGAARDAARYAARVPVDCSGGVGAGTIPASFETTAKNLALYGDPDASEPARISYWTDPSTVTIGVDCRDNSGGAFGADPLAPVITVDINLGYQDIGLLSLIELGSVPLTVHYEQPHIGE